MENKREREKIQTERELSEMKKESKVAKEEKDKIEKEYTGRFSRSNWSKSWIITFGELFELKPIVKLSVTVEPTLRFLLKWHVLSLLVPESNDVYKSELLFKVNFKWIIFENFYILFFDF